MEGIAIPLAASASRTVRRLHGTPAFAGIRVAGDFPWTIVMVYLWTSDPGIRLSSPLVHSELTGSVPATQSPDPLRKA